MKSYRAAAIAFGLLVALPGCGGESVHATCEHGWRQIVIPDQFRPFYAESGVVHEGRAYVLSVSANSSIYPSASTGLVYEPRSGFRRMSEPRDPNIWALSGHVVTAGDEIVVFPLADPGGRYHTRTDTWRHCRGCRTTRLPDHLSLAAVSMGNRIAVSAERLVGRDGGPVLSSEAQFLTYAPGDDTWQERGPPLPELFATALVWTGSEVLAWGGWTNDAYRLPLSIGSRYDPRLDRWTGMSTAGAPTSIVPSDWWRGVWTGSTAVFWALAGAAGRYDTTGDTWRDVTPDGDAVLGGVAAEAMGRVVSWTGYALSVYDPEQDSWFMPSMHCGPTPRSQPLLLRVDDGVMLWGGAAATCLGSADLRACIGASLQQVYYLPDDALLGERQSGDAPDCSCPPPLSP